MRKEEKERSEGIYNIQGAREREGESEKHAWLMVKKKYNIYTNTHHSIHSVQRTKYSVLGKVGSSSTEWGDLTNDSKNNSGYFQAGKIQWYLLMVDISKS